ncbi:MAG: bacteriochlorophyll 4-vinyl reductase, partial [Gemmatimonadota bacterium]
MVQTLRALSESRGTGAADELARRAALPEHTWDHLIPEAWFLRIIRELRAMLPPEDAEAVLRRAGALTGAYVRENRIPRVFRLALTLLPAPVAVPLLLRAFRRHAWTFAGSGRFAVEGPTPGVLVLEAAPTCRVHGGAPRSGSYYEAAFETLLALAAPG